MGYNVEELNVPQIVSATCDKCGATYNNEDEIFEFQEMVHFGDTGGYTSHWGDGTAWSVLFCSACSVEVLAPYAVLE